MNKKGFTLVELIVAISIGLIIMLAIYAAVEMGQRTSTGVGQKVVSMQDARAALDLMAIEISMASFNPLREVQSANMWKASDCAAQGTQAYKGLQIAKSDEILIEMDLNSNRKICNYTTKCVDDNEIIYYKYDAANFRILRKVSCGPSHPLLGRTDAAGTETNVINDAEEISLFRYYDKAGAEITTLDASQARIPDIRRVEITIAAETAGIDPNTKKKRKMIYSTTVIVRNHVLSP